MKRLLLSLTLAWTSLAPPPAAATATATATATAAAAAAAAPAESAPALPATPAQWRAAALRDVEAAYRVTLANHAGARDPHNPAFLDHLAAARAHGLGLASRVGDGPGYVATLLAFSNRIRDGHAGAYPTFSFGAVRPTQWPGFVAAWRNDLFVHTAQDGAAREGERIVSCDGKPVRRLLEETVFGYFGRIAEEGQWWSESANLFLDFGNPFVPRPRRCLFELDGRRTERDLHWRPMPDAASAWIEASVTGDTLPVGLTELRKNLFWVAMPTFKPSAQERETYRAMYGQVRAERARFLDADAVIIDLRLNSGGNSQWSRDFAAALWGDGRVTRRADASDAREAVWYRASPGNIAHFQGLLEKSAAQGETSFERRLKTLVSDLRAAEAARQPYHVLDTGAREAPADPQADRPDDPPPFTRPVYVIVPGNCASACLDAIDVFKLFPNTRLIGAPSSADSTYMEVRSEKLPGGLARVVVPTKLYVNRPRGNGEFYRPDIPVTALRWTMEAFLDAVERDLARGTRP